MTRGQDPAEGAARLVASVGAFSSTATAAAHTGTACFGEREPTTTVISLFCIIVVCFQADANSTKNGPPEHLFPRK